MSPPSEPDAWERLRNLPPVDAPLGDREWAGGGRVPRVPVAPQQAVQPTPAQTRARAPRASIPADVEAPGSLRTAEPRPSRSQPTRPARSRGRRRRRRARWLLIAMIIVGLVMVVPTGLGLWRYRQIERVSLSDVLATPTGSDMTFLLVGSDSRADVDPNRPDADALLGEPVYGQRADSIILIRVGETSSMVSIPRDLWVRHASGEEQRINAAFNDGAAEMVATVSQAFNVDIHHYAEIDFSGFDALVDAVGGVTVEVPYPAFDPGSGLIINETGSVTLDGQQALAYVRSRRYTETIDGVQRQDPTGDIGRGARQQAFMVSLLSSLGSTRNPLALNSILSGISETVTVDDSLGLIDAARIGRRVAGGPIEQITLPVVPFTTSGGAAVLRLGDGADELLAVFRSESP